MSRIILLGGTGYIGQAFARELAVRAHCLRGPVARPDRLHPV